jgi:hypothetical protein
MLVVMMTIFPCPTDPVLNKITVLPIFTRYSSLAPEAKHCTREPIYPISIDPSLLSLHHQYIPLTLFVVGTVVEMVSKTRPTKEEENPFVPPPVDLDKIPLVEKDHLIADTTCSFDFSDL